MDPDDELEGLVAGIQRRIQIRLYTESLLLALLIPLAYLGAVIYLGWYVVHEIKEEMSFRTKYDGNWREMYEKYHGSLAHAHTKIIVSVVAILAVGAILAWCFCHRASSSRKSQT